ncbi:MAG: hypothetical protein ABSE69_02740 [Roseiarcus sp.]|jgi:hypothetical protein
MRKSMMQLPGMTMALIVGVAAAAPPALAHGYCHWRHPRHVAAAFAHTHWAHARWAYNGWGPGVGFEPVTGVTVFHPPAYNHPYYYGGGPYGICGSTRPILDASGNIVGWQAVYIC